MNTVYLRLCSALKQARIDAGRSQSDLATQVNRTPQFIDEYERGERVLLLKDLLIVAHALNVDPATLLEQQSALGYDGFGTHS